MTEIDLLDSDGVIRSIASVDENFWNANGPQMTALARQKGGDTYAPGRPPDPGAAERSVSSVGDFQNWMSTVQFSGELDIKHMPDGSIVMTHQPHGDIGFEMGSGMGPGGLESLATDADIADMGCDGDEMGFDLPLWMRQPKSLHAPRWMRSPFGVFGDEPVIRLVAPMRPTPAPAKKEGFFAKLFHKIGAVFHGEEDDDPKTLSGMPIPTNKFRGIDRVMHMGGGGFSASQFMDPDDGDRADFPNAPLIAGEGDWGPRLSRMGGDGSGDGIHGVHALGTMTETSRVNFYDDEEARALGHHAATFGGSHGGGGGGGGGRGGGGFVVPVSGGLFTDADDLGCIPKPGQLKK